MKKIVGVFIPLLLISLITVTVSFAATVTIEASINNGTGKVNISGKISTGSEQQVTVLVISPSGTIDYVDQTTSGVDGSYQFAYHVQASNKGTYQVTVSGTEVDKESKTTFEYDGSSFIDNEAPKIEVTMTHDDKEYTSHSWTNKAVNISVSATDRHSDVTSLQILIDQEAVGSVDGVTHEFKLDQSGIYEVFIKAIDEAGNEKVEERTIKISKDGLTLEPSLQQVDGISYESGDWTKHDVIASIKAENIDGAQVKKQYSLDKGETWKAYTDSVIFSEGVHHIWFQAEDEAGNHVLEKVTIHIDQTAPELKLNGDNPLIIEVGTSYDEPGAVATDNLAGDISADIEISGEVDVNKSGVYNVHYNVRDKAGNKASQVVREVHVVTTKVISITLDTQPVPVYAGALIKIEGTNATVQLPNDLPEGTTLQIETVDIALEDYQQVGDVFDFIFTYPEGEEDYTGIFGLTLGIDKDADNIAIYHYHDNEKTVEFVGGEIENGLISAMVEDLSTHGVFSKVEENGEVTPPKGDKEDGLLPKTATHLYDWLLIGLVLLGVGVVVWTLYRRQNRLE